VDRDQFSNTCNIDDLTIKQISVVKNSTVQRSKALVGSNPVIPLTQDQIQVQMHKTLNASPAKRARVEGYMHSNGIKQNIYTFKDNDCTKGIVTVKP